MCRNTCKHSPIDENKHILIHISTHTYKSSQKYISLHTQETWSTQPHSATQGTYIRTKGHYCANNRQQTHMETNTHTCPHPHTEMNRNIPHNKAHIHTFIHKHMQTHIHIHTLLSTEWPSRKLLPFITFFYCRGW